MRCVLISLLISLVASAFSAFVGYALGAIATETRVAREQIQHDTRLIRRVISGRPEFKLLEISYDTSGYAFVYGEVPNAAAKEKLIRLLIEEQGAEWTSSRLHSGGGVVVVPIPASNDVKGNDKKSEKRSARGQEKAAGLFLPALPLSATFSVPRRFPIWES
jgi:hypothetical protein